MAVNLTNILSTLITANHILAYHSVLDAFGHISARNPVNTSTFYLARQLAPALVSTPADLVEYDISTAQPVLGAAAPAGYIERYIHSEVYKRYPAVASVVHSHSQDVIPFGVVDVPFTALDQAGSVLGTNNTAPVWDIATARLPADTPSLLITNERFGASLAATFDPANTTTTNDTTPPPHAVVLMRGHGMTVAGTSITDAVFRAVYAAVAASEGLAAVTLAALGGGGGGAVRYLSGEEMVAVGGEGVLSNQGRAWEFWVREVEAAARGRLYRNELGSPI